MKKLILGVILLIVSSFFFSSCEKTDSKEKFVLVGMTFSHDGIFVSNSVIWFKAEVFYSNFKSSDFVKIDSTKFYKNYTIMSQEKSKKVIAYYSINIESTSKNNYIKK